LYRFTIDQSTDVDTLLGYTVLLAATFRELPVLCKKSHIVSLGYRPVIGPIASSIYTVPV
jgi:hypothetical protein